MKPSDQKGVTGPLNVQPCRHSFSRYSVRSTLEVVERVAFVPELGHPVCALPVSWSMLMDLYCLRDAFELQIQQELREVLDKVLRWQAQQADGMELTLTGPTGRLLGCQIVASEEMQTLQFMRQGVCVNTLYPLQLLRTVHVPWLEFHLQTGLP